MTEPFRLRIPLLLVVIPAILAFVALTAAVVVLRYRWVAPRVRFRWRWDERALEAAGDLAVGLLVEFPAPLIMLVGMPLVFLLIPVTLRQARVRRAHVIRIWLYSLLLPLVVTSGILALWAIGVLAGIGWLEKVVSPWAWASQVPLSDRLIPFVMRRSATSLVPGLLLTVWFGLWWRCACRQYLRLGKWKLIVMTLLGVLWFASFVAECWVRYT